VAGELKREFSLECSIRIFAAGTPQLITPFAHEQFDNAVRASSAWCADFKWTTPKVLRVCRPRSSVLLEDESIQQNCAAIRSKSIPVNVVPKSNDRARGNCSWGDPLDPL